MAGKEEFKYRKEEYKRHLESKSKKKDSYINKNIKVYNVSKESILFDFLLNILKDQSKNNIKMLLTKHFVAVNGLCVTQYNYELYKGDSVQISKVAFTKMNDTPIKKENNKVKESIFNTIDIIYEDDEFLVINKPSGLLSVESDNEKCNTAYKMALQYTQQEYSKNIRCFQTHRIDKETSGVLLFCKDYELNNTLKHVWNKVVTIRKYVAITDGHLPKKEDTITNYLLKNENNLMYSSKDYVHGEKAITHYVVKKTNSRYSLVDVYIDSGKKNQIRVTLNDLNCPIIGDDKYGMPSNPINRLGLHAEVLELNHPITNKHYKFVAPIPSSFRKIFSK